MAFRCYNCDQERPQKDFGKRIADKSICKFCLPYVDEGDIGSMILFEQKGKAHRPKQIGRDRNK